MATTEGFGNEDQILRIASTDEPSSLDPRLSRDVPSITYLFMLYEGLMRLDTQGRPKPALAEEMSLFPDQKTYTFKLRKSNWSNGDPVTAEDFVRTWKSVLDPTFPAPNAYQLYVIKGAKDAKEGKIALDEIGVHAPDPQTLVVELETPLIYFPDLLASYFFLPVHAQSTSENLIGNGPFLVHAWKKQNEFVAKRNPYYWDAQEVRLDGVIIQQLDEHTALRLFENGDLDWAGSPMGTLPQDAVATLRAQRLLHIANAAGTHWFRINTEKSPFNNQQMRRALALALNRKAIVEHVTQGYQRPAEAIVPPSLGLHLKSYFEDADIPAAFTAFQEALKELHLSIDDIPPITLSYGSSDRDHKIAQAVQQQWSKALGLDIQLQSLELQVFREKLKQGDFQIASGGWYADYHDPINFLEVFKYKTNATNATRWEDPHYTELLNASSSEADPLKRLDMLKSAEAILLEQMPVAPLFFAVFNYVKDDNLLGVYFSDLGYLDFKYAFFGD